MAGGVTEAEEKLKLLRAEAASYMAKHPHGATELARERAEQRRMKSVLRQLHGTGVNINLPNISVPEPRRTTPQEGSPTIFTGCENGVAASWTIWARRM